MQDTIPMMDRESQRGNAAGPAPLTWRQLRHDIRNQLNAIVLSCAVLKRRAGADENVTESVADIERSVQGINELVGRSIEMPGMPDVGTDHPIHHR